MPQYPPEIAPRATVVQGRGTYVESICRAGRVLPRRHVRNLQAVATRQLVWAARVHCEWGQTKEVSVKEPLLCKYMPQKLAECNGTCAVTEETCAPKQRPCTTHEHSPTPWYAQACFPDDRAVLVGRCEAAKLQAKSAVQMPHMRALERWRGWPSARRRFGDAAVSWGAKPVEICILGA